MLILAQNEEQLINLDTVQTIEIDLDEEENNCRILCTYHDYYSVCIGEYRAPSRAKRVLRDIYRIYSDGYRVFFMPQDQEEP